MNEVQKKGFCCIMWKGVCNLGSDFLRLFGYKREGWLAKCVWRVFSTSIALIVALIAWALFLSFYNYLSREYRMHYCHNDTCSYLYHLSANVVYHDHCDGNAWIKNTMSDKKTLTGIKWIALPESKDDSLCVYSDGKKRGYFNRYTGEVTIPARFDHAWVFSGGIASVEKDGIISFIDSKGRQVFDRTFIYDPNGCSYVYHGTYCIVDENNDGVVGLMNMRGETVLPEVYDNIEYYNCVNYWKLEIGKESGVIDGNLVKILPMMACNVYIYDSGIDVTMVDNTMRKYDLQGNLIEDFYIYAFEYLEYELEETYSVKQKTEDEEGNCYDETVVEHKKARARLCKYSTYEGMEGLITAEGHIVTLPKYEYIKAIGPDSYLCTVANGGKEIINGKGERWK